MQFDSFWEAARAPVLQGDAQHEAGERRRGPRAAPAAPGGDRAGRSVRPRSPSSPPRLPRLPPTPVGCPQGFAGRTQIVNDGEGTPAPGTQPTVHATRPPRAGHRASHLPKVAVPRRLRRLAGQQGVCHLRAGRPTFLLSFRLSSATATSRALPRETATLRKCRRCPTAPPGPTSGGGGEELPRPTALLRRRPVVLARSRQRPPGLFPRGLRRGGRGAPGAATGGGSPRAEPGAERWRLSALPLGPPAVLRPGLSAWPPGRRGSLLALPRRLPQPLGRPPAAAAPGSVGPAPALPGHGLGEGRFPAVAAPQSGLVPPEGRSQPREGRPPRGGSSRPLGTECFGWVRPAGSQQWSLPEKAGRGAGARAPEKGSGVSVKGRAGSAPGNRCGTSLNIAEVCSFSCCRDHLSATLCCVTGFTNIIWTQILEFANIGSYS